MKAEPDTFNIFARILTWVGLLASSLAFTSFITPNLLAEELSREEKIELYSRTLQDVTLRDLIQRYSEHPEDTILRTELLRRIPLSPLDMFQLRMELSFHEYVIPREVYAFHQDWLKVHEGLTRNNREGMLKPLNFYVELENGTGGQSLAPVVGTNRDVAYTNNPPPTEYQGEVQGAVDRTNPNRLIAGANTWDAPGSCDQTQAIFYSSNGGTSWGYTCAPSVGAYGQSCPGGGIVFGSDPEIEWNDAGNAYFNYMLLCCDISCQFGFSLPTSAIAVAQSTNGGATWTGKALISNHLNNTNNFDDKEFYAIDNNPSSPYYGRHYSCWDINNNEVIAYSTNGGSTWTQVDLPNKNLDLGCEMAIGDNGTVYLVWDSLTCGQQTCTAEASYFTKSTNGGVSWSTPVQVVNHNLVSFSGSNKPPVEDQRGINPFGAIDRDNNPNSSCYGTLYFAYTDYPNGGNAAQSNIYVKRSTNDGATWGAAVKVNDDSTTRTQWHPFLTVDPTDGSVIVGWHDARNDPNNKKTDYYLARSVDCGLTWEGNIKVSQPSSEFNNSTISYTDENSGDNTNSNPNQYGEYLGVDAYNRMAYMFWTDSRQFYPGSTGNTQKENVGFATVTFCSAPSAPGTPTLTPGCNGSNPKVDLSWTAPSNWGTNATGGTYSVERATTSGGPYTVLVTGLTGTTYTDTTVQSNTTYYYHILAKNNCPGTPLTAMSTTGGTASTTTGSCVAPDIDPLPPTLDFGNILVGTSLTNTLTLNNQGNANLQVTSISILGGLPFTIISQNCTGSPIPPSGSCSIDIQFSPVNPGNYADTLSILSNDPDESTLNIPLSGNGVTALLNAYAINLTGGNGNGLWEIGENVSVSPTWENPGTTDVTNVTGSVTSSDPVTITDSQGIYGTIPANGTKTCTDCYAVTAVGPRPSTHWDVNLKETLSTFGVKNWALHVGESFNDVSQSHPFYSYIETLLHSGVTGGCTTTDFCPVGEVTRAQMAIFLSRSMAGGDSAIPSSGSYGSCMYNCTSGGTSCFSDITPTTSYCKHVHYIASQGVTGGCTSTTYCPQATVTRSQMAVFLARIMAGGDGNVPVSGSYGACGYSCISGGTSCFTDIDPTVSYCRHVHYIASQGVTGGCTPSAFCPLAPNTRGEMAVFLTRVFGYILYGP